MKEHDEENYLSNLDHKYSEVDENKFKISMKLKDFP